MMTSFHPDISGCIQYERTIQAPKLSPFPSNALRRKRLLLQPMTNFPDVYGKGIINNFFSYLFHQNKKLEEGSIECDLFRSIQLNGSPCRDLATRAVQELIIDVHKQWFKYLDFAHLFFYINKWKPPLFTWTNDTQPYSWAKENLSHYKMNISFYAVPTKNAVGGFFEWHMLAQQVAGAHLVERIPGLVNEAQLEFEKKLKSTIYWKTRAKSLLSDTLSILALGPMSAVALFGFTKIHGSFNQKNQDKAFLSDSERIYFTAEVTSHLPIKSAKVWASYLKSQVEKQLSPKMQNTIKKVVKVLLTINFSTLDERSLRELRHWSEKDEKVTQTLRVCFNPAEEVESPDVYRASHVLAAALTEALEPKANRPKIFSLMLTLLSRLDKFNPRRRRSTL